jgi:hypothetical protein
MMRWLLDLDQRAACTGQFAQLGVHDVAEIEDHRLVVDAEFVSQHADESGGADGAELHGTVRQTLGDLPERCIFPPFASFCHVTMLARRAGATMFGLTVINHPPSIESGKATISYGPPGPGMFKNTIPLDRTGCVMSLRCWVFESRPISSMNGFITTGVVSDLSPACTAALRSRRRHANWKAFPRRADGR